MHLEPEFGPQCLKSKLTVFHIHSEAVLLPHPSVLSTASHDSQTVCDAMEAGHDEPEAFDEGKHHQNKHSST